jgi:5S rRNA maturation endonuclease (ribonuclease M5)
VVARDRRRHPCQARKPRAAYYGWKRDQIEKALDALRKRSTAGVPIIVEGRRDREALVKLGVNGTFLSLKGGGETKSHFLDRISEFHDVTILTDFDAKGSELRLWLYQELTRKRIRADDLSWRRIRSLSRAQVRAVEELPSFLISIEAQSRGERPTKPRLVRAVSGLHS